VQLKALLTEEQEESSQILVLSVDSRDDLQRMVDRISADDSLAPTFPFLTDTGHQVIDRYGLYNPDDPRGRQITHPATYVIDREGVVRWKFVEVDYRVRPSNEDVLAAIAELRSTE
jgi:peroxiredoxin